ncbi:MAG: hypothetical protein ND895_02390 [Pyrinomonadaceae bacterium]|nr:hypothetical protein [Pyrinomonadaceae bacterium]
MDDFTFFESLTQKEAQDYLEAFRSECSSKIVETLRDASSAGVRTDFSLESIAPLMVWLLPRLDTIARPEDPAVAEWIRVTPGYKSGLYDFSEPAKSLLRQMAYYLGETFVRHFPALRWSTGQKKSALCHMPVITGFAHQLELPPLLVVENSLRKMIEAGTSDCVTKAVTVWSEFVDA